jgi:hypothetical protein
MAAPECRSTVRDTIQASVILYANGSNEENALRAMEVGMAFPFPYSSHIDVKSAETSNYWREVSNTVRVKTDSRLESLASHRFLAFALWSSAIGFPLDKISTWYTLDHIFLTQRSSVYRDLYYISYAERALLAVRASSSIDDAQLSFPVERIRELERLGNLVGNISMPCLSTQVVKWFWERGFYRWSESLASATTEYERDSVGKARVPITDKASVGIWFIVAAIAENAAPTALGEFLKQLESRNPFLSAVVEAVMGRIFPSQLGSSPPWLKLKNLGLTPSGLRLIQQWIGRELNLIE